MSDTKPWVLKYAPTTVDEMILSPSLKEVFDNIINTRKLSNLTIFGEPGIGKTTLAKILVSQLNCDYWLQPCSSDGSIDMVKSTIKNFCEIIPKGEYKIIILDEADQLSMQAQMALRNIIFDSMDNCRFILTANYQDKIIDALKSRCTPIKLEFSTKDVLEHCTNLLKKEKIKVDKNVLLEFYKEVVVKRYPDIRTIIEHLQMMSVTGKLKILTSGTVEIKNDIVKYIYDNVKSMKIQALREYLISNEDKFSSDYVGLAQSLFDAYSDNENAMLIIADALWRMSFQLDKEIQFIGMLLNLKNNLKE